MIIGIDIDDTLTYLHDIKIKIAKQYIKEHNLPYKLVRTDTYLFSEMFDWPIEECDKFWFANADKMLAEVKARQYAAEVISKLKHNGHKILIITARTKEWHADPYKLSYDWLVQNNIPFDELLVEYTDKTQICIDKKVDLFIDDRPKTLVKLNEVGIKTIMIKNPHNEMLQNDGKFTFAENWNDVYYIVKGLEKSDERIIKP